MRARLVFAIALAVTVGVAGCGSGKVVEPRPETVIGTIAAQTLPKGDPAAGKALFSAQGCNGCHTLKEAGASGTTGPNLDEALKGKNEEFIRESIVNPNAQIASGYAANIMPSTYGAKLSQQQLADLVAFLAKSTS